MKKQTFKNELHNLAEIFKELRELFKLSQTRFAQLLGVNRSVIASIEQEKHLPNMFVILKSAKSLELHLRNLCQEPLLIGSCLQIKKNVPFCIKHCVIR